MKRISIFSTALLAVCAAFVMLGCGAKEDGAPKTGWQFKCVTESGEVVPGVAIQMCTSDKCHIVKCDDKGIGVFDEGAKEAAEYEVHIQKIPSGYELSGEVPDKVTSDNRLITIVFKEK